MIIKATYGESNQTIVVTLSGGTVLWVPNDLLNAQRQELAAWVAKGNTIAPYVAPSPTADQTRVADILTQPDYVDITNRMRTATSAQIDAWLTANVTSLAQARTVLGALIKVFAANPPS